MDRPDRFALVLERLRARGCRVRIRSANSARAQCPAHADRNPSLLVTQLENRVVVKCFRGCPKPDVLKALDLTYGDLYYRPRAAAEKPKIVAAYGYTELDGAIIAEKIRTDRKQFFWRMPDGTRGLRGCTVGLFGLPDLIDARQVLKVEGERAVLLLREHNFVATCGPAGCTQWRDEWAMALWHIGCHEVIILPDNDQPGRRHAERVAASCYGRVGCPQSDAGDVAEPWASWPSVRLTDPTAPPLKVKLLDLPGLAAGADVVDFLQGGHTSAELRNLIERCPYWQPGQDEERRRQRRRELTRARVRKHRERLRADIRSVTASSTDIRSVTPPVTRNAVTHPNVLLDHITEEMNQERAA